MVLEKSSGKSPIGASEEGKKGENTTMVVHAILLFPKWEIPLQGAEGQHLGADDKLTFLQSEKTWQLFPVRSYFTDQVLWSNMFIRNLSSG